MFLRETPELGRIPGNFLNFGRFFAFSGSFSAQRETNSTPGPAIVPSPEVARELPISVPIATKIGLGTLP